MSGGAPVYPGDEKARAVFAKYLPGVPFEKLRGTMMGHILGVEFVMPSDVYRLFRNPDDPGFETMEDAQECLSTFMGLWNELARAHQSEERPYPFATIPGGNARGAEKWIEAAKLRDAELDAFLEGLVETGVPFGDEGEDPDEPSPPEIVFTSLPLFLEASGSAIERAIEEVKSGKPNWREINALVRDTENLYCELWPGFIRQIKLLRMQGPPARGHDADTVVYTEPKIGRNDPCLCGSGKKFKKCCLQ